MSNRFYDNQFKFAEAYKKKDIKTAEKIVKHQLDLLLDLDELLSHRSEFCFSRWINDAHALATDKNEKHYFDRNARTLLTSWGDIRGNTSALYDYAWREWNGLIKEYYYKRWKMFYEKALHCLKHKRPLFIINGNGYGGRYYYKAYPFGKELNQFEMNWLKEYKEYPQSETTNVLPKAKEYAKKWGLINE